MKSMNFYCIRTYKAVKRGSKAKLLAVIPFNPLWPQAKSQLVHFGGLEAGVTFP